eukprot:6267894-Pyramimonas_sp.AAC.1
MSSRRRRGAHCRELLGAVGRGENPDLPGQHGGVLSPRWLLDASRMIVGVAILMGAMQPSS